LRPYTRTSFHHQPEAQHPNSSAIHKNVGRLPHLWANSGHDRCPILTRELNRAVRCAKSGFLKRNKRGRKTA
jgi:hypothetical protein